MTKITFEWVLIMDSKICVTAVIKQSELFVLRKVRRSQCLSGLW
jgi:hypothetical protein